MSVLSHLGEAFVAVADSLSEGAHPHGHLRRLTAYCVDLLDLPAAGILLADPHGDLHTVIASDARTDLLGGLAVEHAQGPGVEAFWTGTVRTDIDLTTERASDAWPVFAPRARDAGFRRVHALALRRQARVIGSLSLFQSDTAPLDREDIALAQALADVATIAHLQHRTLDGYRRELARLQDPQGYAAPP